MKREKTGGRDFKKGESGNPNGRPPLPEDIKIAKRMSQFELERIGNKYLYMSQERLIEKYKSPKTRGFDKVFLGIILRGMKGDVKAANFIADRLIGKVKTVVEVSGPGGEPIEARISRYTAEEIAARKAALLAKALAEEE